MVLSPFTGGFVLHVKQCVIIAMTWDIINQSAIKRTKKLYYVQDSACSQIYVDILDILQLNLGGIFSSSSQDVIVKLIGIPTSFCVDIGSHHNNQKDTFDGQFQGQLLMKSASKLRGLD